MAETHVERIGEDMELIIDGLPKQMMSAAQTAKASLALVQHGLPIAANTVSGIAGTVRTATLRIGREYYLLKYSLRVMKMMTALEVYSEAIDYINFQSGRRFDPAMASHAINYLRAEFSREFY